MSLNIVCGKKFFRVLSVCLIVILITIVIAGYISVWYVLRPWNNEVNFLKGEGVKITSLDGISLTGNKHYATENTNNWALIVHSYRSHKSAMSVYEKHYHENGYNTLCVDNRAHGQSGGKYIGMGYLDKYDIASWVDYILAEDIEAKIVLHGLSMGGSAVMMYSGEDIVPANIVAVIEDSGYVSAESYLKWKLKQTFGLPSFPIINIANISTKIAAGYYLTDASALEAVKKSNVPTLFIHCDDDKTVPVHDAYMLYDNAACPKDVLIIKDAGHGEAVSKSAEEYWNNIDSFVEKVLKNEI